MIDTLQPIAQPMFSEGAEQNLIACLFADPNVLDEVAASITPESFYCAYHKVIYEAIVWVAQSNRRPDAASVWDRLTDLREDKTISREYLTDLAGQRLFADNWSQYAESVSDKAMRRQLAALSVQMDRDAKMPTGPAVQMLDQYAAALSAIAQSGKADTVQELRAVLQECLNVIDERTTNSQSIIPTGYIRLDQNIGGFRPGQLIIIGARPAHGKSAVAVNFALMAARRVPVLIFSQEMASYEIGFRILAIRSGVDLKAITGTRPFQTDEADCVVGAAAHGTDHGFYIDDRPHLSAADVARTVRLCKRKYGIKLVMIDYLQRMNHGGNKNDTHARKVGDTAKAMKTLARQENIPVLCLAQLNRDVDGRGDEPRMSDLKESGDLEQEADLIMLLHPGETTGDVQPLSVIIAKQRNGPVGTVDFDFIRSITKLEDRMPTL